MSIWRWKLGLVTSLTICGSISSNCSLAQITPDGTLPNNSIVTSSGNTSVIEGGTQAGSNLFHSFDKFSIPTEGEVLFNNDLKIQNIVSRVTGPSASSIDGLIKTQGTANLFLLNPNGIIFGSNASLNIGGSFLASTASSLNLADGTQFTATAPQVTPLLSVSVPVGLQFGTNPGRIINRSQASTNGVNNSQDLPPVGLQVQEGKTLALVGGDVLFEGGNLTAERGRIELGSVAGNGQVSFKPTQEGLLLGYEGVQDFKDIQLSQNSVVEASGKGGGEIQLQGRAIKLIDSLLIANTTGELQSGNLTVTASESIELTGVGTSLSTLAESSRDAGDITINTRQLIVKDGAQVFTATNGKGSGGQLTVNASDSVKLIGSHPIPLTDRIEYAPSSLISSTVDDGNAGNLTINTGRLLIQDGALVSTESADRFDPNSGQSIPANGRGGDLMVNSSDSVELRGTRPNGSPSGLFTSTKGAGNAGNLTIFTTGNLIVRDGATVNVSSVGTGNAGNIKVTAGSIRLDNKGKLTATSESGEGGDIRLQDLDLLLLRDKSEIATDASRGSGNGGDINIDTDVLLGVEDSDITATAIGGRGGNIQINTQEIFGIEPRSKRTSESDITASSDLGVDGVVEINRPEIDPSGGLVTLPTELVDVSGLIAQGCSVGGGNTARGASKFVATGRGGLPPTPTEALRSNLALADLGTPVQGDRDRASAASTNPTNSQPTPLVEAQGWVIGSKGEVVLVAQAPTVTPHTPWLKPTTCNGS